MCNISKSKASLHFGVLQCSLDLYSINHENLIIIGELNTETKQQCMKIFYKTNS